MLKFSNFKILFLAFGLFLTTCTNSNLVTQTPKLQETTGGAIIVTPTPFLGQRAIIRGENTAIKIDEDFEKSIKKQESPNIWLEFENENGEKLKVSLNNKIDSDLDTVWKASLNYKYIKKYSKIPNELAQSIFEFDVRSINFGNELEKLEINSPNGLRRMTEEEIRDIRYMQVDLMKERFDDLEKYFNLQS